MGKKLSIDICHKIAKSRDGACLSSEYKNTVTKMLWRCNKCNFAWRATLDSIKNQNSWCPECGKKSFKTAMKKRKISTIKVKLEAELNSRNNTVLLSNIDSITDYDNIVCLQCLKCDRMFYPTVDAIIYKQTGCPFCAGNAPGTCDPVSKKIRTNLRARLLQAINKDYKAGSAVRDLGCTIEELKKHLESKFQEDMSWDNYGIHGWHIDHVRSLSSFDLSDPEELKEACHYTNLQPLWAKDNLKKGRT